MKKVYVKPRHKIAIRNVGKYGNEAKALEALGYSPSYAKNGSIKNTKSWKEYSAKVLNNELLAETNLWLLDFKKHGKKWWQAVNAGLDKAYKARKIYINGDNHDGESDAISDADIENAISAIISGAISAIIRQGKKESE